MFARARYLFVFLLIGLLGFVSCDDEKDPIIQPDTTPPSAVSTLAVGTATSATVPLTWTAVGDDASTGTATSYDMRYSTATITDANWAAATQAAGEPTPKAAGQAETFTVTGLTASTTYYFALKVGDEIPNWSALSTVQGATAAIGEGDYEASGTIGSTESGAVTTASGASINVPLYAVPPTEGGESNQMVFSIERDETVTTTPPTGTTVASDVYRLGPDGFTFGEMVEVTVPVTGTVGSQDVGLFRIDQTTGASEPFGGAYDPATNTITAQTYHLSPWYVGTYDPSDVAWGAFKITNLTATHWLHLCVVEYSLKYPTHDANFTGDAWSQWAPSGTTGWASSGNWYLPQGTYRLCVSMSTRGTISQPPGIPWHGFVDDALLDVSWTRTNPRTTDMTFSSPPDPKTEGPCDCTPTATPPVGTGDVQITLTWHSAAAIDIDLHVTEPNGEICYYGHNPTSTGGTLDRDNRCYNYENGRPENIFWTSAPLGTYTVIVNLFSTCSAGPSSQSFDVRIVTGSTTKTYAGTVTTSNTNVTVATFTIGNLAPGPQAQGFSDYLGTPAQLPDGPPKK